MCLSNLTLCVAGVCAQYEWWADRFILELCAAAILRLGSRMVGLCCRTCVAELGRPIRFGVCFLFGIVPPGALARPVLCSPLIILRASCACVRVYICVVVRSWLVNVFKSIKNRIFGRKSGGKIWRFRGKGVTLHSLSGRRSPAGGPKGL